MSVRLRRLRSEYERLTTVLDRHERIRIEKVTGDPPERYTLEYRIKGLVEDGDRIVERDLHRAEIMLGVDYPKEMPRCVMLTPIFHPNIDHLAICTEDIGSVGQRLDETVIFIGEMIAFQAYNLQSPRNGDAARWTRDHLERLPLDPVDLFPHRLMDRAADSSIALSAGIVDPPALTSICPGCGQPSPSIGPCAGGHDVCGDCKRPCGNCGAATCSNCAPHRCRICRQLFCGDCAIACDRCGSWVCLAHMKQACDVCAQTLSRN